MPTAHYYQHTAREIIGNQMMLTFSTCVHDAIVKYIRSEQTRLDLDSGNLMDGAGPANSGCADLKPGSSNLAFCNKFGECFDRCLDWHARINSDQLKVFSSLDVLENPVSLVDRGANCLRATCRFPSGS